jgi:hypothetical protein
LEVNAHRLGVVGLEGDVPTQLPVPRGGFVSYSPDDTKIAYNRVFREFRTWKQYRGGMADDIWIFDLKSGALENITDKNFQVNSNCFCSSDSTTIENGIYDGYDDITRGLVNYAIYDDSCSSIVTYVTKVVLNEPSGLSELNAMWKIWQEANQRKIFVSMQFQKLNIIFFLYIYRILRGLLIVFLVCII